MWKPKQKSTGVKPMKLKSERKQYAAILKPPALGGKSRIAGVGWPKKPIAVEGEAAY